MMSGSALAGEFLATATGRMVQGGYLDPGTVMTTLSWSPAWPARSRWAGGWPEVEREIRDFKFEISNN